MAKKDSHKFRFTTEWQLDLLKFTITQPEGYRALKKYKNTYFSLIEHQAIAFALEKFYKKYKKIPGKTMLKQTLVDIFTTRDFIDLITKSDQTDILLLVDDLYDKALDNPDIIYDQCKMFSKYVKFRDEIESVDIDDFEKFGTYSKKIQKSLEDSDELENLKEGLLIQNLKFRQMKRQEKSTTSPTPFKQLNKLTNNKGYDDGSVLVVIDKQKKGKTIVLVNAARGYLRNKRKILYIDLENGRDSIMSRMEQSIMNITKEELMSGEFDIKIQKKFRKYKRLGGEIVVERMPANVTTADDIQTVIDDYYNRMGIKFDILIIDWIGKMGSISGKVDDFGRISDAYVDVANLVEKNGIIHCWSANHITREGMKRMATKYKPEDIAKCIDISRHVHGIFGLNRSPDEADAGFQRMEIVEQRDGVDNGRAVFLIDRARQRLDELTISQRREYDEAFYEKFKDEPEDDDTKRKTRTVKSDGDI